MDFTLEDLLEDIKYKNTGGSSYTFLIMTSGAIIYHPRLPQGTEAVIQSVECSPGVENVLTAMKKWGMFLITGYFLNI